MEYKIEKKPTLWHIDLRRGAYSDRTEDHVFIGANSAEEAWLFFTKYLDTINDLYYSRIFWKKKKFILESCENKSGDYSDFYDDWVAEIGMLEVLYTHSI